MKVIFLMLLPLLVQAGVVGTDDRLTIGQFEKIQKKISSYGFATQLNSQYLNYSNGEITYPSGRIHNLCPGDKFQGIKTLGGCSGFLISDQVLVTAGHCAEYSMGCQQDSWLFDHRENPSYPKHKIKWENLYHCEEVLAYRHDHQGDYAVLKLEKKVLGFNPIPLARKGELKLSTPVLVAGYPLGFPLTISSNGRVKKVSKDILMTDVDAFKNNSGSVIINQLTGEALGVLTNSKRGLSFSSLDGCRETISHPQEDHLTLAYKLDFIPYIKKHFLGEVGPIGLQIQGLHQQKTQLIIKYRSLKNNSWTTELVPIKAGEKTPLFYSNNDEFYIHLSTENQKIIKGKDFFGFASLDRQEELGFKKFSGRGQTLILEELR